jgi:hypothetical protein
MFIRPAQLGRIFSSWAIYSLFFSILSLSAQSPEGDNYRDCTDSSGAVILNGSITVTNVDTGIQSRADSGTEGYSEKTGWWSPAQAIERLREKSSRLMMEAGRFSAEEIDRKNGLEVASGCSVRSSGHSDSHHRQFKRTVSALSA